MAGSGSFAVMDGETGQRLIRIITVAAITAILTAVGFWPWHPPASSGRVRVARL